MEQRFLLLVIALSWATTSHAGGQETVVGRVEEFEVSLRQKAEDSQGLRVSDGPPVTNPLPELDATGTPEQGKTGSSDDSEAWDLLQRHVAFPGGDTCGTWSTQYKDLHRRIMTGEEPNPRYLVHYGIEGLSNRLYGIMTALMTALVTSRAILIIDDRLPLAFNPSQVDWEVPPGLREKIRLTEVEMNPEIPRGVNDSRKDSELDFFRYWITRDPDFPWNAKAYFDRPNLEVLKLSTNRNSVNEILHPWMSKSPTAEALRAMGITPENVHACMLRFLLKPKEQVLAPLVPHVRRLRMSRRQSMCFHVRVWDYTAWNWKGELHNGEIDNGTQAKLTSALDCANKVVETLPAERKQQAEKNGLTWLMMSNWRPVVREAKKMYPERVMESPVVPRHITLDTDATLAMESAVQDWLLFSLCDFYFFSNSGFSKTSMAFGGRTEAVFKTPLYTPTPWKKPDGPGPECHARNTYKMEELF